MQHGPFAAVIWMMGAALSFTAMAIAGRELWTELNTFELMLYRSVIGVVIITLLIARSRGGLAQIKTVQTGLHIKRNVAHFAAQNLWFYGVAVIELSQLVALEFTNPIWVAIMAPFLLGERLTRWRLLAAVLGFIGVLIIARPGVAPLELGHLAGLGAALGFALNTMFTKRLMAHDSVLCVLFWMTLSQALMALVLSLPGGIPWPSETAMPWVIVVGICGLTAHFCLTNALSLTSAMIVAPLEFMRLPIVALAGVVLYKEPLAITIFIGAAFILAGNMISIYRDSRSAG